jgi:hypothetical protein
MPDPVCILERLNWRPVGPLWLAPPGADPLRSFADRAAAEAEARDREWAVRRRVNPFECGGPFLHYQTSFDAARLFDWFLDLGLDPPEPTTESSAWARAWEANLPTMSDAQRAGAWEVLDRVRFFRATEGPARQPMHLVANPRYERDPIQLDPDRWEPTRYVGCTPYMLVRRIETADRLCQDLYTEWMIRTGHDLGRVSNPEHWVLPDPDPFTRDETPEDLWYGVGPQSFAEHRPLNLIADRDPTPGQTLYVVLRRRWRLELDTDGSWRWSPTEARTCGRPVAAFETLAAADARVADLEAEARAYPAPFRFGPPHEWGTLDPPRLFGVLSELAPIDFASLWNDYTVPDRLWAAWWDAIVPTLTPEQIAFAWSLFDKLRFYEVVEVEYRE